MSWLSVGHTTGLVILMVVEIADICNQLLFVVVKPRTFLSLFAGLNM